MIKNIIFDFDGTIGNSTNLIVKCFRDTFSELNLPYRSDDEFKDTIGLPLKDAFKMLGAESEELIEKCDKKYEEVFKRNNKPHSVKPFKNVVKTIKLLHNKGIVQTIATSRRSWSAKELLCEMGIDHCFKCIVGADNVKHHKPHPEPVLATLNQLNLNQQETIVVGDTWFDIEMAHNANVKAIGVTFGNGTKESLENVDADYIIDNFEQILDCIEKENNK